MVRTDDTGKKKKSVSADGSKAKKDTDRSSKPASVPDKKKPEASSSKAAIPQKGKDSSKDRSAAKEVNVKAKKPTVRAPKKPEQAKKTDDYLGDIDLPSSSDEDEGPETNGHQPLYTGEEKEEELKPKVTERDKKKLADKDRKLQEKAHQQKLAALADDDDVFDVAFEQQGEGTATASATDIQVRNLTMRAKGKILLEHTEVNVVYGRRYGLVGPNGMGKSTLLRMLARRQIPVPEGLDILLVEQEVVGDDRTALQAVVAADAELMSLREEEAQLTQRLDATHLDSSADANGAGPSTSGEDADSDRLAAIYERMQEIGASSAEARASKILHGLGFTEVMQKRVTQLFSGGWRMRISLARALYIQPSVLLLDEPTNHLDLRAVLWLEEYLTRWKKTLVVVSHDRDFLNTVTTDIIHLHDQRLAFYRGNFVQFEDMYEQKRAEANKVAEKFEKQMKAAKKSGSKANQDKVTKSAKQAQQRKAGRGAPAYDDAPSAVAEAPRRWTDYNVHFEFPEPPDVGSASLIQLMDVNFKYPGREDFGLADLNIGIDMGSRVAIVGPNGAGKTTLMNLLGGELQPSQGEFRRSHTLRVARYAQHFVDALQMDESPVEYLLNKFPQAGLKPEQMRAQLGRFGLSGHHHLQPICKLSGGQKSRVVFTSISLACPHILLLDEPTNHLDMQSIDALADALEQFEGGVVCISHDSQLLSRVCDDAERSEVWLVEDGKVERYDGYFEDYKDELIKEIAADLEDD
ncbi:hypothetical protein WJX73_004190 [Symbiochloris irregularis]|uniref:ABC transporter domain-containing protein n=1 Tax=Symbiochloris irregularis TaxID=706552 RepID=A0AAW1NWG3_9CHLO